jgi:hypothetical protein
VGRHTGAGAASGQTLRSKVEVLRDSAFSTIAAAVEISAAAGWDPRYDVAPLVDAIWALDKSADVSRLAVP